MTWLDGVAESWFGWMWPMFWQVNLLIAIVWLLDALLRRWAWPQVRYALWLLVLLKLVIPPTWTLPVSVIEPLVRPVAERIEFGTELLPSGGGAAPAAEAPPQDDPASPAGPGNSAPSRTAGAAGPAWQVWPFAVWIAGMAVICAVLWLRLRGLRRWHDAQHPRQTIPEWYHELLTGITRDWELARLPAIVFSDEVVTPAVCGVWRPVLFLPRKYLDTLSREEARHVLLHELAHLKRGDLWLHAAAMALQIVYWFNPLLALARRRIQHVREICCDLTVAGELREETEGYRDTLLGTARELLSQSVAPGLGLLGVFEEPFRLVPRLRWLERKSWLWQRQAFATAAVVALAAAPLLLPMGSIGAVTAEIGGGWRGQENLDLRVAMVPRDEPAPRRTRETALYQRNLLTRDRLCLGFRYESAILAKSELWIGDDWVAEKAYGRTLVVDFGESTLTYIDPEEGVWSDTPLPLDLDALYDEDLRRRKHDARSYGEVTETGRTRKVKDVPCREYRVESWRIHEGLRHDRSNLRVWASDEPPYYSRVFAGFLEVLRQLQGRDAGFRRELNKIRGLQLRLEFQEGRMWDRVRWVDLLDELAVVPVPGDLREPPAHCERVERLAAFR
jgi:beta-lactamase regulating signal transducer with metallopeptidase domain